MTDHSASPFESQAPAAGRLAGRVAFFVIVIGSSVGAAWWFTRSGKEASAAPRAAVAADSGGRAVVLTAASAARIGVTYAVVEHGVLASDVRTVGLVTFDETRVKSISPKVEGFVEQLFVNSTGQPVDVGDPLLRIYSPMLVTAQEELLLARKLAADVADGTSDAGRNADAMLTGARRRLENWDVAVEDIARVERTGEVQRTLTLRSPLRGIVVQKNVSSGQRIMPGDAVYQVADLREVWLEGEVFERDLASIRLGETVDAELPAMPDRPREGRIVYISPMVSPETRTTKIRVALTNGDLALKPGMYASIRVRNNARREVLSVPRAAVLATGTRTLVFVKGADGSLLPREVLLGASNDDRMEIVRGLSAGETVVASATFLIDAESNLGAALGAMSSMPGMDAPPPKSGAGQPDPMADMPGMNHAARKP